MTTYRLMNDRYAWPSAPDPLPRCCRECGKAMLATRVTRSYHPTTGEALTEDGWACPEYDWYVSHHDRYVLAKGQMTPEDESKELVEAIDRHLFTESHSGTRSS